MFAEFMMEARTANDTGWLSFVSTSFEKAVGSSRPRMGAPSASVFSFGRDGSGYYIIVILFVHVIALNRLAVN